MLLIDKHAAHERILFDKMRLNEKPLMPQELLEPQPFNTDPDGAALLKGAARGSWSCFDMSMSILPAFILTALCLLANITLSVLGLMQGAGVWFAMRSLLECMGSILATLLVLGGITVASEWRRIHAPAWKKIAFTLTFPLFMLTYLPISLAALFMKVEWKPIHHSVNLTSLPSPAVKN